MMSEAHMNCEAHVYRKNTRKTIYSPKSTTDFLCGSVGVTLSPLSHSLSVQAVDIYI